MIRKAILPALALGLLLTSAAAGQHHHVVNSKMDYDDPSGGDPNPPAACTGVQAKITITANSSAFSPSAITVDPGEAVCWTWSETSIPHNIRADDGSYTSGPPEDRGTFQKTFSEPGTYGYHCQVHGSPTAGMRGTVIVRGGGGGGGGEGPGKLEVSPTYSVSEGAGTLTVTVERADGSDGAASVKIATAPGSAKPGKDFSTKNGTLSWASGDQSPKTFQVPLKNDTAPEPNETFAVKLSKATGASMGNSTSTVTIQDDDSPGCNAGLTVPTQLRAQGQSPGEIRLTWADESSAASSIRIERREPGGTFQEIALLPAGPAGTTRFTDTGLPGGATFHYRVRAEGIDGVSPFSAIAAGATDASTAACDETRALCLHGGRFEATLQGSGREAKRLALPGAVRSGLFALSAEGTPQLLLNVSNGCAVNGHFGIDLAAVTDAEFTVKVRDTHTGRTWVYFNPEGSTPAPIRDADAFSTCQ